MRLWNAIGCKWRVEDVVSFDVSECQRLRSTGGLDESVGFAACLVLGAFWGLAGTGEAFGARVHRWVRTHVHACWGDEVHSVISQ